MMIRQTSKDDVVQILLLFEDAKKFIASYGSDQWQEEDYPNNTIIEDDIDKNGSFVLEIDGKIVGYIFLSYEKEQCYKNIKNGRWDSNFDYTVIHRLAISSEYRGKNLSKELFDFVENKTKEDNIRSIRVDTHKLNSPMKSIMKKRKYKKCGIITLEDGQSRDAYEKLLIPFLVDDKVELRKQHPCGCNTFDIKRIGMDIKLECNKCNSQIWLSRSDLEKRIKNRL